MADVTPDLLFKDAPGTTDLVFGASDAPPAFDAVLVADLGQLTFSAQFSQGFRGSLDVALPALSFEAAYIPSLRAALTVSLPGLSFSGVAEYESRTARPLVNKADNGWQSAGGLGAGVQAGHEVADRVQATLGNAWQQALGQFSGTALRHQDTLRLRASPVSGFESAKPAQGEAVAVASQDAIRARSTVTSIFSAGQPAGRRLDSAYQDCLRDHRLSVVSVFTAGLRSDRPLDQKIALALPHRIGRQSRFQAAIRPNGKIISVVPPVVPVSPCYVPSGNLVFSYPLGVPGELLFICDRAEELPDPVNQVIIPIRSAYVVLNNISLVRSIGNVDLQALSLEIGFDADSWVSTFSATIPESSRDAVMPDPQPVEVLASVNGTSFRFIVERIGRARSFGKRSVTISGRGIACELDAPYAPATQHMNLGDRTAQQLVSDALQFSGYEISWGLTDWLVPSGALSVAGAPIVVAQAVAEAAGAALSADWSARKLHFMPRYPVKPWAWPAATPEYVIPAAVTQTENIEWMETPAYNAVFVAGERVGVIGHVKIAGTAADLVAPMVTHPLITHADAARQRGVSILGRGGRRAQMQISLPILPELGVVNHGKLIEFSDGADTRRGIVRANRITDNRPTVRQTLTIEAAA